MKDEEYDFIMTQQMKNRLTSSNQSSCVSSLFKDSNQNLVSRETMNKVLWQKIEVNPNSLDVLLYKLRKKIGDHGYRIEKYGT